MDLRIHLERNILRDGWSVIAYFSKGDQRVPIEINVKVGSPVGLYQETKESGFITTEDMKPFADAMKEALAEAGFLQHVGPIEGELKATKVHLEDMRSLVFKKAKP